MKEHLRIKNDLIPQFEEYYVKHIPKEENAKANVLSNYASSEIENYDGTVYYEVLKTSTIEIRLVAL